MDDAAQDFQDGSGQERLAQLCQRLAEPFGPFSTPGPARDLADRIITGIRSGQRLGELTARFDELEQLLADKPAPPSLAGRYVHGPPSSYILDGSAPGAGSAPPAAYAPLPGLGHGHPLLEVLACPTGLCTRVEPPAGAEAGPECRVLAQPLRRVRLRQ